MHVPRDASTGHGKIRGCAAGARIRPNWHRLLFEPLEDRRLLAAAAYQVTPIGALDGVSTSIALSINNHGHITGVTNVPNVSGQEEHAFL